MRDYSGLGPSIIRFEFTVVNFTGQAIAIGTLNKEFDSHLAFPRFVDNRLQNETIRVKSVLYFYQLFILLSSSSPLRLKNDRWKKATSQQQMNRGRAKLSY